MKCTAIWSQRGGNKMKAGRKRLNSRGSSLIVVIVGAAFLGILAALILSITYTNINLKTADKKSKKNFYTEEVAVNELTAKLEEFSADSMTTAYTWLVKNYQKESVDLSKCYEEYKKQYMIALSQKLHNTPTVDAEVADKYNITVLQDAISSFSKTPTDPKHVLVNVYTTGAPLSEGSIEHSTDTAGNNTYEWLTIKNLSITFKDANDYETNIVTDINMAFPMAGGVDTAFAKYALVSDQLIDCTSSVEVTGGVYAGETAEQASGAGDKVNPNIGGILVENNSGNLRINGNGNIVATRGNITAYSYGKLSIQNAKVWAKNIMTFGIGDPVNFTPSINIDAVTKVQDDLIMKAPNSTIALKNSYYGFSYKSKDAFGKKTNSDTSSAITINAKNVSLDTTGLNNLVLFGRAFVSSSDTGNDSATAPSEMMDIMTGQALGVKYDQGIYLVPNDTFLKIPANPVSIDVVQKYAKSLYEHDADYDPSAPHLLLKMKDDIVDFTKGDAAVIHHLLDPNLPIRAIYYKQGTGSSAPQMVNYYWNFKDEKSANEYFEWYFDKYGKKPGNTLWDTFKQFYRLNGGKYELKFKPNAFTRLEIASDILYQDANTGIFTIKKGLTADMKAESSQLSTAYHSVALNLRENGDATKVVEDNPYVNSHFNLNNVKHNPKIISGTGIKSTVSNTEANVYISNDAEFHVTTGMAGLVIASGDVVVDAIEFEGTIIADGKIILSTNSSINADEKMVLDLLSWCQNNGNKLKDYIYGYDNASTGAAGDDSIDYGAAISFENWKKNA